VYQTLCTNLFSSAELTFAAKINANRSYVYRSVAGVSDTGLGGISVLITVAFWVLLCPQCLAPTITGHTVHDVHHDALYGRPYGVL
jgi:hypothetical protein